MTPEAEPSFLEKARPLDSGGQGRDAVYVEGPHDDTWRIMHTLRQNVGDGNFHYLAGLRS